MDPALVNYMDRYIFATGPTVSVEVYDMQLDRWTFAPDMIHQRQKHSACCIGDIIYVSCGYSQAKGTSSIEYLDAGAVIRGEEAQWTIL